MNLIIDELNRALTLFLHINIYHIDMSATYLILVLDFRMAFLQLYSDV